MSEIKQVFPRPPIIFTWDETLSSFDNVCVCLEKLKWNPHEIVAIQQPKHYVELMVFIKELTKAGGGTYRERVDWGKSWDSY